MTLADATVNRACRPRVRLRVRVDIERRQAYEKKKDIGNVSAFFVDDASVPSVRVLIIIKLE